MPSSIREYAQTPLETSADQASVLRAAIRRWIPGELRENLRRLFTYAMQSTQKRKLNDAILNSDRIALHLGCGYTHLDGWINIDLYGSAADIAWDLRRPLPLADGVATEVFCEHLMEHLPLEDALVLLAECRRVLKKDGLLRVGVPDAGAYFRSYAGLTEFLDECRPARPTKILAVAEVVYGYGHRSIWDAETLVGSCLEAGFSTAERRDFGVSGIAGGAPDSASRRQETLYVEATA
jgi:predicted SAM-dependent methyltransferase